MKIIIIPMLKFISSIIFSILILLIEIIATILSLLWDFKLPNYEYEYEYTKMSRNINFYFIPDELDKNEWSKTYKFKSVFHYIWNIK